MSHYRDFEELLSPAREECKRYIREMAPWHTMAWMGYHVGEHLAEMDKQEAIKKVVDRLGDRRLVLRAGHYGDPYEGHGSYSSCETHTVSEIVAEIYDWRYCNRRLLDSIISLDALANVYSDMYDYEDSQFLSLMTRKQDREIQADIERRELEEEAKKVAASHKVGVNTMAFIKAVKKDLREVRREQANWNSGEARMEEYAAHLYNGTRDAYWDDLNFENDRYGTRRERLEKILRWLASECPLLWAKYKERSVRK